MAKKNDAFFSKRRNGLAPRPAGGRPTRPNSFLIVSEGTRTEPSYFLGMRDYILGRFGGVIDVEAPSIDVMGQGRGTCALVRRAEDIVSRGAVLYRRVWIVFDKDDFSDFDEAVRLAKSLGYKTAWSNECFEYWLDLHFEYADKPMGRKYWLSRMESHFRNGKIDGGHYRKNCPNLFLACTRCGSLKSAVERARRVYARYPKTHKPSQRTPATSVYTLIDALRPYLKDLL